MGNISKNSLESVNKGRPLNFYFWMNISLLFILPALSIIGEIRMEHAAFDWQLTGKWFIFWAVGIRLFTAGVKQSSSPEFTGTRIFNFRHRESQVVIRELGFANMALGAMGILSVLNDQWRLIAGIGSCLFFGMAGLQHSFKKPDSLNEMIALVYDLLVATILLLYIFLH